MRQPSDSEDRQLLAVQVATVSSNAFNAAEETTAPQDSRERAFYSLRRNATNSGNKIEKPAKIFLPVDFVDICWENAAERDSQCRRGVSIQPLLPRA